MTGSNFPAGSAPQTGDTSAPAQNPTQPYGTPAENQQPNYGYPQQPNLQQGGYGTQPPKQKTNTLAIVSLIAAFFVNIVGIICGHIALGQIKRSGENGRGLAIAGVVIGYVSVFFWTLGVVIFFTVFAASFDNMANVNKPQTTQEIPNLPNIPDLPSLPNLPNAEEETSGGNLLPDRETNATSGEYSPQFCNLLDEIASYDLEDVTADDRQLDILQQFASIPSPNQQIYQKVFESVNDPSTPLNDRIDAMTDYIDAYLKDTIACLGM